MAADIRAVLRLLKLYARMDFRWFFQDMTTAIIVVLSETLSNLSSLTGVLLLAIRFGGVGGFTADEVLFMLGFYELADGICWMLFGNYNVMHISRRVGRGQIDHMLIQPRPLWMQLLTEGFMPFSGCYGAITGVLLTAIALRRMQLGITPVWVGLLVYYILIHIALRLSQSFLYGSLAFKSPVACEEISSLTVDLANKLGKFPLYGLPGWLMTALHTVLPIGLLGYFPALALLRELGKGVELAFPLCVALLFAAAAIICFRKGLRHYEEYSCNRYSTMGFRN